MHRQTVSLFFQFDAVFRLEAAETFASFFNIAEIGCKGPDFKS